MPGSAELPRHRPQLALEATHSTLSPRPRALSPPPDELSRSVGCPTQQHSAHRCWKAVCSTRAHSSSRASTESSHPAAEPFTPLGADLVSAAPRPSASFPPSSLIARVLPSHPSPSGWVGKPTPTPCPGCPASAHSATPRFSHCWPPAYSITHSVISSQTCVLHLLAERLPELHLDISEGS